MTGFGTGLASNRPLITHNDLAVLIIMAVGNLFSWGAIVFVGWKYHVLWSILLYLSARSLERPLLRMLFKGDCYSAKQIEQEILNDDYFKYYVQQEGFDPRDTVRKW